jgi:hypothetical protein
LGTTTVAGSKSGKEGLGDIMNDKKHVNRTRMFCLVSHFNEFEKIGNYSLIFALGEIFCQMYYIKYVDIFHLSIQNMEK